MKIISRLLGEYKFIVVLHNFYFQNAQWPHKQVFRFAQFSHPYLRSCKFTRWSFWNCNVDNAIRDIVVVVVSLIESFHETRGKLNRTDRFDNSLFPCDYRSIWARELRCVRNSWGRLSGAITGSWPVASQRYYSARRNLQPVPSRVNDGAGPVLPPNAPLNPPSTEPKFKP